MFDFRRICYLLKSPDFVRKVGGHAPDYPQMRKVLKNLHKRLKKKEIKSDIIKVLISIITDIAYENPRTYPHTSAILSKL